MSKIRLTESDIRKMVEESTIMALNELSSDYLKSAEDAFNKKYGSQFDHGQLTNTLKKDKYGNLLHPKDGRPIADHYRDFSNAIHNAKKREQFDDPLVKQAYDIWEENQDDAEWEEIDRDGGECWGNLYLEVDGWKFCGSASAFGSPHTNLDIEEVESVEFESPDGKTGSFFLN